MDIKSKTKEKRIQLIGGLIGICVAVVSLFYFFHAEKTEAEKRMVEIVNYVKVQCSTYTHYNESSESKSLLRAIESARQMSTNIKMETENGGQLREDFLKEKRKTDPAVRRSDWSLCGCSLSVLFLPRRKSRSREKNGGDCKLCESAVLHLHPF